MKPRAKGACERRPGCSEATPLKHPEAIDVEKATSIIEGWMGTMVKGWCGIPERPGVGSTLMHATPRAHSHCKSCSPSGVEFVNTHNPRLQTGRDCSCFCRG